MVVSCTDPTSDVGLNLIGDDANPQIETIRATSLSRSSLVDITGAVARVLVGEVDDPVTGHITAGGFFDFSGKFSGSASDTLKSVQLKLSQDYTYGDTASVVQISLHQITKEWNEAGLRADTVLSIGPEILTAVLQDTVTVVELPTAWISANESVLRSDDFGTQFHGFALIGSGSGQVVGLNASSTSLVVNSSAGSTTYTVSSTYTQIERLRPAQVSGGLVLFQDGAGPAVEFDFAFEAFKNRPINGVILTFSSDTLASQVAPENFVRPAPQVLQLVAVPTDDATPPLLLGQTTIDQNGEYQFSGRDLSLFFQGVFLGSEQYQRLELRAPVLNHSLNAVLLYGTDAEDRSPKVTIIFSP